MRQTCPPLKKHDKVRIIAPGALSPITNPEAPSHWDDLEKCCELLKSWDLEPVYSQNIFGEHKSYYNFSNTDDLRSQDFIDAFSSDAALVWSFRGGYGSDRVVQAAVQDNFKPTQPKLFIGFSDVTNLHNYINAHWQWNSLHALSLRQLGLHLTAPADIAETKEIIFGEKKSVKLQLTPLNEPASQKQKITAQVTGGNMSIVQSSIGTPWATPLKDNFLLLEDVGEAPYRIARMFQQLLNSELLKSVKAVILGDFIPNKDMALVIQEFVEQAKLPVLHCEGIGHGKHNHPVPLGMQSVLHMGDDTFLEIAAN
jgi:muramoyltetrapeptide carboxypeptidase